MAGDCRVAELNLRLPEGGHTGEQRRWEASGSPVRGLRCTQPRACKPACVARSPRRDAPNPCRLGNHGRQQGSQGSQVSAGAAAQHHAARALEPLNHVQPVGGRQVVGAGAAGGARRQLRRRRLQLALDALGEAGDLRGGGQPGERRVGGRGCGEGQGRATASCVVQARPRARPPALRPDGPTRRSCTPTSSARVSPSLVTFLAKPATRWLRLRLQRLGGRGGGRIKRGRGRRRRRRLLHRRLREEGPGASARPAGPPRNSRLVQQALRLVQGVSRLHSEERGGRVGAGMPQRPPGPPRSHVGSLHTHHGAREAGGARADKAGVEARCPIDAGVLQMGLAAMHDSRSAPPRPAGRLWAAVQRCMYMGRAAAQDACIAPSAPLLVQIDTKHGHLLRHQGHRRPAVRARCGAAPGSRRRSGGPRPCRPHRRLRAPPPGRRPGSLHGRGAGVERRRPEH